jgi:signal transduction histidine kinase
MLNESSNQAARLIEAERAQIAHEIHDSVLPLLFAASASLSNLIDRYGQDFRPEILERLQQVDQWVDEAMQTGRRLMTEIYPPELQSTVWSLAARDAIQRLLGDAARCVRWQLDPEVNKVADPIAFAAYRIVVEAVRNAIAHGKASEVVVSGECRDRQLQVRIRDDGSGFDPDQLPPERFGVRSMVTRAKLVGGSLQIDSANGGPTSVQLTVPEAV